LSLISLDSYPGNPTSRLGDILVWQPPDGVGSGYGYEVI
jgi:hypothetical protein